MRKKLIAIIFSALLFSCLTINAFATTNAKPPQSYADAVKIAAPSVVNVYTIHYVPQPRSASQLYKNDKRSANLGSGVIMNSEGYILTNYHVVRRADQVLVALDDGRRSRAVVDGVDQDTDLAVLRIPLKDLKPAILAKPGSLHVGDVVLAIGNPFGLGQSVTQGIVSALGRNTIGINQLENYIQTDAAINPGNSGGALINTNGEVVGINTGIYSRSGGYQGIGFAIPIEVALNVMHQIITTGSVKRGWLGVRIRTVVPALVKSMKLSRTSGVVVVGFSKNSPAKEAGMKEGDVISFVNDERVQSAQGFLSYIAQRTPGSKVVVVFTRDHQTYRLEIKVGTRPPQPLIDDRGREDEKLSPQSSHAE